MVSWDIVTLVLILFHMCSRTASSVWVVSNCFGAAPSPGDMARSFTRSISRVGDHDLAHIGFEEQSEVSGSLISNLTYFIICMHRNQRRFFRDFLLPRQPTSSTFISKEYFFDDSVAPLPPISSELHQVMHARVSENLGP